MPFLPPSFSWFACSSAARRCSTDAAPLARAASSARTAVRTLTRFSRSAEAGGEPAVEGWGDGTYTSRQTQPAGDVHLVVPPQQRVPDRVGDPFGRDRSRPRTR